MTSKCQKWDSRASRPAADHATHEPNPQAVSALRVGIVDARAIASSLTLAQCKVVASLPADGSFGPASSHRTARYMWYGIGKGRWVRLVEHQHRTDNSWCLNKLGIAVRQVMDEILCIGCNMPITNKPFVLDANGETGCPACFTVNGSGECWHLDALASAMSAGTAETAQQAQGEARQRGPAKQGDAR